jgi:tagatose-1,6-bisphosphate aldolase non-catalytic subunit AgaZ/GatZ
MLSQYLPDEARAVRDGSLPAQPSLQDLIRHKIILTVLDDYAAAWWHALTAGAAPAEDPRAAGG